MSDLDFMGYKRVILKSDQEPSIAALVQAGGTGDAALHAVCATTVDSIEGGLGRVEATLKADPAAAALVSSMLTGTK